MFDKLLFNNLIISNKKKIQQSQTQTFNKLNKKKKKLKYRLEKQPDDMKIKEHFRKTNECLEQLKKLKCVEIITGILLLEKTPNAIITNGLATPEEIAIAMLAMNKIIQDLIPKFREELKLETTEWRDDILQPSKRRQKINKTDEKRQKRKALKEQKTMERNRNEWMLTNSGAQKIDENSDDIETKLIKTKVVDSHVVQPAEEYEESEVLKPVTKLLKKAREKDNKNSEKLKETPPKKNLRSKSKEEKIHKKNREMHAEPVENEAVTLPDDEPPLTHIVDPFFITASGANYLSTAVITRSTNEAATKPSISKMHASKDENYSNRNHKRSLNNGAILKSNKRLHDVDEELNVATSGNLHPSWAAKQKLKPIISTFHGKKIVFSDDGTVVKNKADQKKVKKIETPTADLHPSWAAKQKLKPIITSFQGKKITFDDNE